MTIKNLIMTPEHEAKVRAFHAQNPMDQVGPVLAELDETRFWEAHHRQFRERELGLAAYLILQRDKAIAQRDRLHHALSSAVEIAAIAHRHWDADEESKVGKILLALSGDLKGYRDDTTEIHNALKECK